MELEFDKEMDSLLRQADRGVLIGDKPDEKPKVHLDADQLSAFAENAVPERSRGLYMTHLADCDRCRKVLSGLISLNAEAMPEENRVVAPVISPGVIEPWYRRLLLPNLAYIMGGLVLVFGGLIAISLLRSDRVGESAIVSQVADQSPAARGPMFSETQTGTAQLENANTASNSNAASAPADITSDDRGARSGNASNSASASPAPLAAPVDPAKHAEIRSVNETKGSTLDGVSAAKPAMTAPAEPPVPTKSEAAEVTVEADSKDEAKSRSVSAKRIEDLPLNQRQVQDLSRTQAGGVAKSTPGPSRDNAQNFPNRSNNTFELFEERRVSGKTFQRRDGVWYDASYRSQGTKSVRRGTEEYRDLDKGLRTIAESLSGVVVVVWEGKAYRIQ